MMNKFVTGIVLAAACLASSGCATLGAVFTRGNVHKGCEEAIKGAHTVQDVTVILQRYGLSAPDAHEIANNAATGELLISQVCLVADALLASNARPSGVKLAAR
jgi:hypothetical protein